ncbi:hypothetical protein TKK_0004601 [Trichogramma kaykai]|uniref:Uncharacterized protein n=1 Tax=Trichogramma kaykai TaxID=54128 RepID=A0ABD2XMB9_9HYME
MPPTPDSSGASCSPAKRQLRKYASAIEWAFATKPKPSPRELPPAEETVYLRCDEASTRVFLCDRRHLCERSSVFERELTKTNAPRVVLLRGLEAASVLKLHDALTFGNALVLHHELPGYSRLAKSLGLSENIGVNAFPWDHPQEQKIERKRFCRKVDVSSPWGQLDVTIDGENLELKPKLISPKSSRKS